SKASRQADLIKSLPTCIRNTAFTAVPCLCDAGIAGRGDTRVNLGTVGTSYILSPAFLIDSTFGFTRMGQSIISPDFGRNFGSEVLGIPGTNGPDPRQSGMLIGQNESGVNGIENYLK